MLFFNCINKTLLFNIILKTWEKQAFQSTIHVFFAPHRNSHVALIAFIRPFCLQNLQPGRLSSNWIRKFWVTINNGMNVLVLFSIKFIYF